MRVHALPDDLLGLLLQRSQPIPTLKCLCRPCWCSALWGAPTPFCCNGTVPCGVPQPHFAAMAQCPVRCPNPISLQWHSAL